MSPVEVYCGFEASEIRFRLSRPVGDSAVQGNLEFFKTTPESEWKRLPIGGKELVQTVLAVLPGPDDCVTVHADGGISVMIWIVACWHDVFAEVVRILGNWQNGRPLHCQESPNAEVVVAPGCHANTIGWVQSLVASLA